MSIRVSFLFLFVVAFVSTAVVWAIKQRNREQRDPQLGRGGLLSSFGLVFSAPAFLVPSVMTAALVGLIVASTNIGGDNYWKHAGHPESLFTMLGSSMVISGGIAGLIGLLDANMRGARPDSQAFLTGIVDHFLTIFLAKSLLAGWFSLTQTPMRIDGGLLVLLVPAFALAPVIGTASRYPRRPVEAILSSVATSMAHPVATLRVFGAHTLWFVGAVKIYDWTFHSFRYWSDDEVLWHGTMHGANLSFNLFPLLAVASDTESLFLSVPLILLSTAFLTSYWTIANGSPNPATGPEPITEAV